MKTQLSFASARTSARARIRSLAPLTLAALAGLASFSGEALAHTLLVKPAPLINMDNAKSGPCGCEFGGDPACPANVPQTDLIAGESYLVTWKETVDHPGSFRIAFSTKPVDQVTGADLDATVLSDEPDDNNVDGATLSKSIVVPDMPCSSCTLQLRQKMDDNPNNPFYYSCAKIRILAPGGAGGDGGAGGASSGSGGAGGESSGAGGDGEGGDNGIGGSTGPGPAATPPKIETGGACSISVDSDDSALGLVALGALGLAIATRRSRRSIAR